MELTNEFTVGVPVDQAWALLTDLEKIAPSMPGAQLTEVEGEEYRGNVKVKVGPITAQYKGAATFVSKDDANHVAVIKAEGRDTRGQGNASAQITATLVPEGSGTKVTVSTDLTITGKVAQMGRGVMVDVSSKLLDQFVQSLERDVLVEESGAEATDSSTSSEPAPAAEAPAPKPEGVRKIDSPEAQPVDLLDSAGMAVGKRVGPIVGVLVVVLWLLRRRKNKSTK
ncbi:MAG TPA: SRPBCC family protein [Acidimicrobiales bacterium]|nr:SRPBCC family protein [Acidimicrobiales bacterium]